MNNIDESLITQQTLSWIRSFIIEYNICPFAKQVVSQGTLAIRVLQVTELAPALEALMDELHALDAHSTVETSLLVFPNCFPSFYEYLDFVALSEALMEQQGYEGEYQLATFHPEYCFAGVALDDVTNYTNRSPYPMLHILRERSLDKAIDYYGDTTKIPDNNMATMQRFGLEKLTTLLQSLVRPID